MVRSRQKRSKFSDPGLGCLQVSVALLRYDRVGLPGNFLSITFGSMSNVPVDSTCNTSALCA